MLDELPRPNILLLQHLLCVLYHIQENADTNKMDAFNLSVCLGPTLLQLDDTPLDEQPEKMKKVAVSVSMCPPSRVGFLKLCGSECCKPHEVS